MTINIRAPEFFAYSSEHGYETYDTAEKAKNAAESMIGDFLFDGWDKEVETVSWGRVCGCAVMVDKRQAPAGSEFDYTCNYVVEDTPSHEVLLSELIGSEVADLFASYGALGGPESPEDAQAQLITRLAAILKAV
ncbi:hypothetical protein [Pantoea sp. paga]|uniref:hypothetical protein n=1 Tax=Pantoea sp. paga TaxID=2597519 RepID=UPI00117F7304|nr:hypothetical protein [Pantoea sp. paga]TSH78767.1 hypothetical protein FOV68_22075 [Pantoea sp. paga]